MNTHLRKKIVITSVVAATVVAVSGHIVGEPAISLFGAMMIFAALTNFPAGQANDGSDSDS